MACLETAVRPVTIGDQVWIALALLTREQPTRPDFTVDEILARVEAEAIVPVARDSVKANIYGHCVANHAPDPNRLRLLYATSPSTRRLFRLGDYFHPDREGQIGQHGSRITPRSEDIPARYRHLLDWYSKEYASNPEESDPILALYGIGRHLATDEHPDDYVRRLREGWD